MFVVEITDEAESDLEEIWTYIAGNNPGAADRVIDRISVCYDRLAVRPHDGIKLDKVFKGLRCVVAIKKYLVFYRLDESCVRVLRVMHGSRDWEREFRS